MKKNRKPSQSARAKIKLLSLLEKEANSPQVALPSARELERQWAIPFGSINRACNELIAIGVLERKGRKLYPAKKDASNGRAYLVHTIYFHRELERWKLQAINTPQFKVEVATHTWDDDRSFRLAIENTLQERSDGILFSKPVFSDADDLVREIANRGVPAVCVGSFHPHTSSVSICHKLAFDKAIGHLQESGYKKLICLCSDFLSDLERDNLSSGFHFSATAHGYEPEQVSIAYASEYPDQLEHSFQKLWSQSRESIAVVAYNIHIASTLANLAQNAGISIPEQLGIIALDHEPENRQAAHPRISTVTIKDDLIHTLAESLLMSLIRKYANKKSGLKLEHVYVDSDLNIRPSSQANPASGDATSSPEVHPSRQFLPKTKLPDPRISWIDGYHYLRNASRNAFEPLDLGPVANHSLRRKHAWLGDLPLLHLEGGDRWIHGAKFHIIDEAANDRLSTITMRSLRAKSARKKELPSTVRINAAGLVDAVYFLHGCGFAHLHQKFAEYEIVYRDGSTASIPLLPYGHDPEREEDKARRVSESNIQDWWGNPYQHFRETNWRYAMVTDNAVPHTYERYLYTLQWINPNPQTPLDAIVIRSDPESSITLGVIAISLLRPN